MSKNTVSLKARTEIKESREHHYPAVQEQKQNRQFNNQIGFKNLMNSLARSTSEDHDTLLCI
jgi:predicted RNA-binding protein with RPS1 domain